jgi:hypothetical protein
MADLLKVLPDLGWSSSSSLEILISFQGYPGGDSKNYQHDNNDDGKSQAQTNP